MTGDQDDDIRGSESPGRRVRTTSGEHGRWFDGTESDSRTENRQAWPDEGQAHDGDFGDDEDGLNHPPHDADHPVGGQFDPVYSGGAEYPDGADPDGAEYPDGAEFSEGAEYPGGAGYPEGAEYFFDGARYRDTTQSPQDSERLEVGESDFGDVVYLIDDGGPLDGASAGDSRDLGSPARHRRRRASRAESRRRRIFALFAFVVVILVIVGAVGVVYARRAINPRGALGPVVTVKIPQHSSTADIGRILAGAGVIREAHLFPLYTKLTNTGVLLPGTYHLAKNESYSRVIRILENGPPLIVDKLTIPEGFTLEQIADRVAALPGLHLSAAKFLAAASSGRVRSEFEPKGVNNLEGLVFPATYEVRQGQEETDILQEMVNTFDQRVTALGLVTAAAKMHYTPYQVVTVASIVEREAKLESDRPYVASVLYNRLVRKLPLGADSTQTYYLRLTDPSLDPSVAQLNEQSPYNTRLNPGLPPTPISNPGIPSLKAAINPPSSPYLYFVEINPDGKLGFASDAAGFAELQAECRSARLC